MRGDLYCMLGAFLYKGRLQVTPHPTMLCPMGGLIHADFISPTRTEMDSNRFRLRMKIYMRDGELQGDLKPQP